MHEAICCCDVLLRHVALCVPTFRGRSCWKKRFTETGIRAWRVCDTQGIHNKLNIF